MSRNSAERNAVLIVTTAEEFKPQKPWDIPENISNGRLFKKNLLARDAKHFARTFNMAAVDSRCRGSWNHEWAVVVPCLRRKWSDHPNKQPRQPPLPPVREGETGITYWLRRSIFKAISMLAQGIHCLEVEKRLNVAPGTVERWFKENPIYAERCRLQAIDTAEKVLQWAEKGDEDHV